MSLNGPGQCGCGSWDSWGAYAYTFCIMGGIAKLCDFTGEVNEGQLWFPDDVAPDLTCQAGAFPDTYLELTITNTDSEISDDNTGSRVRSLHKVWGSMTNNLLTDTDTITYGNEHTVIPNPARTWTLSSETVTHNTTTRYRVVREYSFDENGETGTWTSTRDIQLAQQFTFLQFVAAAESLYNNSMFSEASLRAMAPDNVTFIKRYWLNDASEIEEVPFTITSAIGAWYPSDMEPDAYYSIGQTVPTNPPQFEGLRSIRVIGTSDIGRYTLVNGSMSHDVGTLTNACATSASEASTTEDLSGVGSVYTYCSALGYEIYRPI